MCHQHCSSHKCKAQLYRVCNEESWLHPSQTQYTWETQREREEHREGPWAEEVHCVVEEQIESEETRTDEEHWMQIQTMDFRAEFIAACGKQRTGKLDGSVREKGEKSEDTSKLLHGQQLLIKIPII